MIVLSRPSLRCRSCGAASDTIITLSKPHEAPVVLAALCECDARTWTVDGVEVDCRTAVVAAVTPRHTRAERAKAARRRRAAHR